MKILITGINGQVGHALMRKLIDHDLVGLTRKDCDLTDTEQIKHVIDLHQPDMIINPAAYTNVDQAEDESELAFRINRDAPKVMAEKARENNVPFIHFSTDYIFDGQKVTAYEEDEIAYPLGVYGQSKLAGDKEIQGVGGKYYIFRTSWVYSNIGQNFYLKIKKLSLEEKELKVVSDQLGVPTSNYFIAEQIKQIITLLDDNNSGVYNLVPNGSCSWYDFARLIIKKSNPDFNLENIYPIYSHELQSKTERPKNSILNNDKIKKTFDLTINDWRKELEKIINEA